MCEKQTFSSLAVADNCKSNWTAHNKNKHWPGVWTTLQSAVYFLSTSTWTFKEPGLHPPINVVWFLALSQHVFSSSVHVGQFFEAGSPFIEAVIVLVSTARWVQRREASWVRATTFIVKHQQRVIGRCCRVIVCCLQVLREEQRLHFFNILDFFLFYYRGKSGKTLI